MTDIGSTAKFLPLRGEIFAGGKDGKGTRELFNRLEFILNINSHNLE
jgi:hypothetical protein